MLTCTLIIAGFFLFWIVAWWWTHIQGTRLAASRGPFDPDAFFGAFEGQEIPRQVTEVVLRYFQEFMREFQIETFPVQPDDDVEQIYCVDLEEVVGELLKPCGRTWPSAEVMREHATARTVGDVIRFIARCPQAQPTLA